MKARLPVGVIQKLRQNTGGGAHHKKKGNGSYQRKPKHKLRDSREDSSITSLSV